MCIAALPPILRIPPAGPEGLLSMLLAAARADSCLPLPPALCPTAKASGPSRQAGGLREMERSRKVTSPLAGEVGAQHRVSGMGLSAITLSEADRNRCRPLTLPRADARGSLPLPQGEREKCALPPCPQYSVSLRLDRRVYSRCCLPQPARTSVCACLRHCAQQRKRVGPPVKQEGCGGWRGCAKNHLSPLRERSVRSTG